VSSLGGLRSAKRIIEALEGFSAIGDNRNGVENSE
jgi:hypothetical protein